MIGLDGSPAGIAALHWAAARIDVIGPLRPVFAWEYPVAPFLPGPLAGGAAPPAEAMQGAAEEAAAGFLAEIADVPHEPVVVHMGSPEEVLLHAAADAELIVVGCRSRGRVSRYLLGSTSRYLLHHADVPVAVIPEPDDDARDETDAVRPQRILVGVDGSPNAAAALEWAVAHARPDDEVTVVSTWRVPVGLGYDIPQFDTEHLRAAALDTVHDAIDALGDHHATVRGEIAEGDPRWVLTELASRADLLVMGSRGRTGLAHALLGSTTSALTQAPTIPTVVVPHPPTDDAPDADAGAAG